MTQFAVKEIDRALASRNQALMTRSNFSKAENKKVFLKPSFQSNGHIPTKFEYSMPEKWTP